MTRMPVRRPHRRPDRHERRIYWARRSPRRVPRGGVAQYHRIELALRKANDTLTRIESGPGGIRRLALKKTWGKDWQKARRLYRKLGEELSIIQRLQRAVFALRLPQSLDDSVNQSLRKIRERIEDNRTLLKFAALHQEDFRKKVHNQLKRKYQWTILIDANGREVFFFQDPKAKIWFTDATLVAEKFPHLKRLIRSGTQNIRTDNPFADVQGEDTIIIQFTKIAALPGRGKTYIIRRKGESR